MLLGVGGWVCYLCLYMVAILCLWRSVCSWGVWFWFPGCYCAGVVFVAMLVWFGVIAAGVWLFVRLGFGLCVCCCRCWLWGLGVAIVLRTGGCGVLIVTGTYW